MRPPRFEAEVKTGVNIIEAEANEFAKELLMPEDMILAEEAKRPFTDESVEKFAKRLGVSVVALVFRIAEIRKRVKYLRAKKIASSEI